MKKSAGRHAQDVCATTTELVAAMESLSAEELRRLKKAAQYRIRGLDRAAEHRDYDDLLGEAYTSTLKGAEGGAEGRKWAKNRVSLVRHLLEAMRSIANHWRVSWQNSGAECVQPDWLAATEDDEGSERRPTEWAAAPEILEDAEKTGVNLLDEAEEVKGVLRSVGRSFLQRKLRESRAAYETAVSGLQRESCDLPESAEERRQLLHGVLRDRPQFQDIVMTAQHREFSELSDDDVTSFLRQLKSLGLLDLPASPTNK